MLCSSDGLIIGVLPPPSSRLAILGTRAADPRSQQNCLISSSDSKASMKMISAPASAKASTRQSASSKETACRASVLATIKMSAPSSRASTAALMRATASCLPTTLFPLTCPHDLGATWSSISIPARPACAYPRTVRLTFIALPYPVSPSPMMGKLFVASTADRPTSTISAYEISPASGAPSRDPEVANPDMKATLKPARSMSLAERAS
mmetsp:Transcript_9106/g.15884  ORF Transcript_9106/g.15884 Transcript_9106/m.15884 type:complete len:209 (+) Transcript_9106:1211-1837(+)